MPGAGRVAEQLRPNFGTGYWAFAEVRRRSEPGCRGIAVEPDQGFVIAVGRRPEP